MKKLLFVVLNMPLALFGANAENTSEQFRKNVATIQYAQGLMNVEKFNGPAVVKATTNAAVSLLD